MNSYPGDAHLMSIDPIKAERLEQRLTASNSTTNLLMGGANGAASSEPPRPSLLNTPNITLEEEEVSDQEERLCRPDEEDGLSNSRKTASNDGLNFGKGTKRKTSRRFSEQEDKNLMDGYDHFGNDWEKIISWSKLDRTVEQVKRRYTRIKFRHPAAEKRSDDEPIMLTSTASTPSATSSPLVKSEGEEPPRKMQKTFHTPPPAPTAEGAQSDTAEQQRKAWEEIKAQQEQLKAEEKRLAQLQSNVKEREQGLQRREQQLQKYEETLQTKLRHTLQSLLVEQADRERDDARNRVMLDCTRLGQLIWERNSLSEFHETWREGSAFRSLKKKKDAIAQEKVAIEEQKKRMKKSKAKTTSPNRDNEADKEKDAESEETSHQEEIFRLRLQGLKKEEADLEEQYSNLLLDKKLHLRELKRVSDEDNSRFSSHPILHNRYLLLNLLGKGGFSEVYKAFDLQKKANYTKHAVREYNIHKDLVHPRVVQLFDDVYLKTRTKLLEREAKLIILQICDGLKYLNEQKRPVIHYDLKPGNILFSNGGEDGTSMELTSQGAGTYWYLPPECFEIGKAPPKISSKVDVWSVGVIFYQLLYGKKPFGNNCSQQKLLVDQIITKATEVEFPAKPQISPKGKAFIKRCLTPHQSERPDVLTVCEDAYLKEKSTK
ncbi:protein kinase domain containing protein [Acanthamoeba castellanii str. Neff]|uniref:Protein kinase domain containing protein n=1 Tax=Acanthamoeba castellanii (strain ATCC 30010 / Neff) TaxID=1257118 RepID=L8H0B6_ACACF|nr:protein kinase domain containing protein [Acanthamoeba castellanii str. Neff]ELR18208.1 protein kinase domain containing protein [Acanthamoeba castellanii str. Neff]